jgi:hypothetical protein
VSHLEEHDLSSQQNCVEREHDGADATLSKHHLHASQQIKGCGYLLDIGKKMHRQLKLHTPGSLEGLLEGLSAHVRA